MLDINNENLIHCLIERIPELKSSYEAFHEKMGEDFGAHVIYGDILNPYLETLLRSEGHDEQLKRIFDFLEQLASHESVSVQEVVQVTVCERLGDHEEVLARARKYMGENTLRLSREIEKLWGRE